MDGYNVDLLMQVREKIVNEPEKHNQGSWATAQSDPREGGDCGTAYCVAGWAAVLDGQELDWQCGSIGWMASWLAGMDRAIDTHARIVLGLTENEAFRLFLAENRRDDVLDMLDRLIEAGKNGERIDDGDL